MDGSKMARQADKNYGIADSHERCWRVEPKKYAGNFLTVNSESIVEFFAFLKNCYREASRIHVILDNGPYNSSKKTQEYAKNNGIILHYLPPYSPNLNSIERLWKVMNEFTRNNKFFTCPKEFRESISNFFANTWEIIAEKMRLRINDNFQTLPKSIFSG
jgi:transposase